MNTKEERTDAFRIAVERVLDRRRQFAARRAAASAVLAALKAAEPVIVGKLGVDSATAKDVAAAIAQAVAAGIKAGGGHGEG